MDYSILYYVMQVIGILLFSAVICYIILDGITMVLLRLKELTNTTEDK